MYIQGTEYMVTTHNVYKLLQETRGIRLSTWLLGSVYITRDKGDKTKYMVTR